MIPFGKFISQAFSVCSRDNRGSKLSILIYHRVLERPDFLRASEPTVASFDWQMGLLKRYFEPLSLSDALAKLKAGVLPKNAVCVTFDDGYADNATLALPILKKHGIPATIFVSTGFLDGGRMWNDTVIEAVRVSDQLDLTAVDLGVFELSSEDQKLQALGELLKSIKYQPLEKRVDILACIESQVSDRLPTDLMMTSDQVRWVESEGIEIGAHTINHPILTELDSGQARYEILEGKQQLEGILGKPVQWFAYPNGKRGVDYDLTHRSLIEELGFDGAVSTDWGVTTASSDQYQLRRFTPWDNKPFKFFVRLLLNTRQAD
ncbi:polysaccharide deacetylase family protein [Neptunomonas sp. XY-337]|uniref:polysaccharide deacetylase family protein n=1 Tax=Neptunomonas sp. XY-337 TaxID=2561897 RepID=UPI00197CE732|nr:polysaccharide deacetylase family protein [Neptunomonas sp. XY-337]